MSKKGKHFCLSCLKNKKQVEMKKKENVLGKDHFGFNLSVKMHSYECPLCKLIIGRSN